MTTFLSSLSEHKSIVGQDGLLVWRSPVPLSEDPDCSVVINGTTETITMEPVCDTTDISVTAISADRKTLTYSVVNPDPPLAGEGIGGAWGEAWLLTEADGVYSVKVNRITNTTIVLAESLPRTITISGSYGMTIQFSTYTGELDSADICATAQRNLPVTVLYTPYYGADAPTIPPTSETMLLHIVPQVFTTGVTSSQLKTHITQLAGTAPREAQGFEGILETAEAELILTLRRELAILDKYEDDIPAPQMLRSAHMLLAVATIKDFNEPEQADRFRRMARENINTVLKSIWVEEDNDLTTVEENKVTGNLRSDCSYQTDPLNTAIGYSTTKRNVFYRGMGR